MEKQELACEVETKLNLGEVLMAIVENFNSLKKQNFHFWITRFEQQLQVCFPITVIGTTKIGFHHLTILLSDPDNSLPRRGPEEAF